METKYFTVEEVAKLFHVTEYTVRKWLREKKLKGKKIGLKWLIPESELKKI